jgi:hypothetical protein
MNAAPITAQESVATKLVLARLDCQIEKYQRRVEELRATRHYLAEEFEIEDSSSPVASESKGASNVSAPRSETASKSGKASLAQKLDHKQILKDIAMSLAPEFTSHEFRTSLYRFGVPLDQILVRLRMLAHNEPPMVVLAAKRSWRVELLIWSSA